MIFDAHIHTDFSTDSKMQLMDALSKAKEMHIGLITTDHMDLHYPEEEKFIFDIQQYFAAYLPLRSADFLLGIEIGMQSAYAEESQALIDHQPFDYVLGSLHLVEGVDLYYEYFYANRSKQEIYSRYFAEMIDCIKLHPFIDALGHIDYIARYAKYPDPEIYYHEFSEWIDGVLAAILTRDIVLELNTRRMGDRHAMKVLMPIYKRYHDLGGKMVTLGSDAHKSADIGGNFLLAEEFAKACNLQLVYFKNRAIEYMRIK